MEWNCGYSMIAFGFLSQEKLKTKKKTKIESMKPFFLPTIFLILFLFTNFPFFFFPCYRYCCCCCCLVCNFLFAIGGVERQVITLVMAVVGSVVRAECIFRQQWNFYQHIFPLFLIVQSYCL